MNNEQKKVLIKLFFNIKEILKFMNNVFIPPYYVILPTLIKFNPDNQ